MNAEKLDRSETVVLVRRLSRVHALVCTAVVTIKSNVIRDERGRTRLLITCVKTFQFSFRFVNVFAFSLGQECKNKMKKGQQKR